MTELNADDSLGHMVVAVRDKHQHIAAYADPSEPCVCIYTDSGCMELTPEQAAQLAAALLKVADEVASMEVK